MTLTQLLKRKIVVVIKMSYSAAAPKFMYQSSLGSTPFWDVSGKWDAVNKLTHPTLRYLRPVVSCFSSTTCKYRYN